MDRHDLPDLSARIAALPPERRALLARQRRRAGEPPTKLAHDPVAILGAGCRFPGGAGDLGAFWSLLGDRRDAVGEVPADRWDAAALYDPDPAAAGKLNTRWGGFVGDVDRFDAAFFGLSPREAERMDPRHRLLLEVTWEALQDAGVPPTSLAGSRTGVFIAMGPGDHARLALSDVLVADGYSGTGAQACLAANRISYLLDLRGPSLVVDTACSSSLVALHLACRSLLSGECDRAIVGAVHLMLLPEETAAMSRLGMMARDGRCKAFDVRADGFVRGEGGAALVLERLGDALGERRDPLALIRGTAVTQDGRTAGIMAPSGRAQEEALSGALADAALTPDRIELVEAHGTGTSLGDPIEIEALARVMGAPRPDGRPLRVGAVKTNLGHLEAVSGMAGLLKAALCLRLGSIPPNLHFTAPNPHLPLAGTRLSLVVEPTPWPAGPSPRFAGVSAFGVGGTNAHVILEEAPAVRAPAPSADRSELVTLSARSPEALRQLAKAHLDRPHESHGQKLDALSATLALGRDHHEHRVAVVARDQADLAAGLAAFLEGQSRWGLASGRPRVDARPRVVLVFPGQGGQWPGMARSLREPAFREALEACDRALQEAGGPSVLDAIEAGQDCSDRIEILQPTLFALQVGLAAQLLAWGLVPAAVLGHSMGEVAAAHVAGALGLKDAARIIAVRSRLLSTLPRGGAMASLEAPADRVAEILAGLPGLSIAAVNGPTSTVVGGDAQALTTLLSTLDVPSRLIRVDVASHTAWVDPAAQALPEALAGIQPGPARRAMRSTVTGAVVQGPELDASYWAENLRRPVRFWPALEALLAETPTMIVEVGPHPTLLPAIEEGLRLRGSHHLALPTLRRGEDDRGALLGAVGSLWAHGVPPSWQAIYPHPPPRIALPLYPWQRTPMSSPRRAAPSLRPRAFLGDPTPLAEPPGAHLFVLDLSAVPWVLDHRVQGSVLLPGTATFSAAWSAAQAALGPRAGAIGEVTFEEPVAPSDGLGLQLHLVEDHAGASFRIHGRAAGTRAWTIHARGRVLTEPEPIPAVRSGGDPSDEILEELDGPAFYARARGAGNEWGPAFQGIVRIQRGRREILAEIEAPPEVASDPLHPALLDACGQAAMLFGATRAGPLVLGGAERFRVHAPLGRRLVSRISLRREGLTGLTVDVRISDPGGRLLAEMIGVSLCRLGARSQDWLHEVRWQLSPRGEVRGSRSGALLISGQGGGVGERLLALARTSGGRAWALEEGALPDQGSPWDLVHLGALDLPTSWASAAALEAALLEQGATLARLITLATSRGGRLWMATRGAQAVDGGAGSAPQAALWGLLRVLEVEHPGHLGAMIDLPAEAGADQAAELLLQEIQGDDGEREIALRSGDRLALRLQRATVGATGRGRPAPTGITLITGGLGDLGLATAARLVERGARRLALIGRRGLHPGAEPAVRALRAAGAEVITAAVDVGDEQALRTFLDDLRGEVTAVFHAAGVHRPSALVELTPEALREDLRAKVVGGWLLDRLVGEADPFVLFSSAATLLGSPRLGAYTMANAYLDALAHERRARGLSALAIGWGFWDDIGLAAREAREQGRSLLPRGMRALSPGDALDLLDLLLESAPPPQIGALALDVQAFARAYPSAGAAPRLASLVAAAPAEGSSPHPLSAARRALLEGDEGPLTAYLASATAKVLRVAERGLSLDQPLLRLGLDSLMAVELRNRIEADLQVSLPLVSVLACRGVRPLAAEVSQRARMDVEEVTL